MLKYKIGFLGTGIMGSAMVKNLLRSGCNVKVYNRTLSKAIALEPYGAKICSSPSDVIRDSDMVLCCLFDSNAVESIILDNDEVLHSFSPDQIFIDFTTNYPPFTKKLSTTLLKYGVNMLDAPVSGGEVGAKEGALSIMVGGNPEIFNKCIPIFKKLGNTLTHIGNNVGDGCYAKMANQIMVAINMAALVEALSFSKKVNVDTNKLYTALSGGLANSEVLRVKFNKMINEDYAPGGKINVNLKDLNYVNDIMIEEGFNLPTIDLIRKLYDDLSKAGYGDEDHCALIRIFDNISGSKDYQHLRDRE